MTGLYGTAFRYFAALASVALLSGCGFLPGFGLLEDAALYYLPIDTVASRVACELQDFLLEYESQATRYGHKWVMSNSPIAVKLSLVTDQSGYVNFTGINVAQLGLGALQKFITTTTSGKVSTPSLAGKITGKRTRTVEVDFSMSPSDLDSTLYSNQAKSGAPVNCTKWRQSDNPVLSLYLKDWLGNYFNTVNNPIAESEIPGTADSVMQEIDISQVELSTAFQIVADVSGGATANLLGNGSVFIFPVSGLSLDYSPDLTHKVDITIKMCNTEKPGSTCFATAGQTKLWEPISDEQCRVFSAVSPILSGAVISDPGPRLKNGQRVVCNKRIGKYTPDTATQRRIKMLVPRVAAPAPRLAFEDSKEVIDTPVSNVAPSASTFRDESWR